MTSFVAGHLVIGEKWSTLGVLRVLRASDTNLLAKDAWNDDDKSGDEKNTHDDKGEDPLESDGLAKELADTEGSGEDGEGESHGVVLFLRSVKSSTAMGHLQEVALRARGNKCKKYGSCSTHSEGREEEQSIHEDTPDGNVSKDASSQTSSVESDSSVPVQGNESPGQWPGDDWEVDKAWSGWVTEVQARQVEEVDDQDDLGPDEVAADEEHNEGELEEVVEDEVGSDGGGRVDVVSVGGEQVPDITDLEDEQEDPAKVLAYFMSMV